MLQTDLSSVFMLLLKFCPSAMEKRLILCMNFIKIQKQSAHAFVKGTRTTESSNVVLKGDGQNAFLFL